MEEFSDFILFLLMIVYSIFYLFEKFTKPNQTTHSQTVDDLTIPKKRFVELVLSWCHQNLGKPKHGYHLQIYYYSNKKWGGLYSFQNKQIIIYLPKGLKLIDLTNIVIHEYVHYLQLVKPADDSLYNKHTIDVGYWMNPYEIEARELSLKHQDKCMEWVMNNLG